MQFISKKNILIFTGSLLLTGAGLYAAQWKWHFWKKTAVTTAAPVLESPTGAEEQVLAEPSVPVNESGVREVLSAYLFGREEDANKPNAGEPVQKTQQPLELHGIVYIPKHPERSTALIAEAGKPAKSYKVGEELLPLPGWKVFLIAADGVQLEHEGTIELLELSRKFTASPGNFDQTGMDAMQSADGSVADAMPPEEVPQPDQDLPPPDNLDAPPPDSPDAPPPQEVPLPDANAGQQEVPPIPEPVSGEEPPPPEF